MTKRNRPEPEKTHRAAPPAGRAGRSVARPAANKFFALLAVVLLCLTSIAAQDKTAVLKPDEPIDYGSSDFGFEDCGSRLTEVNLYLLGNGLARYREFENEYIVPSRTNCVYQKAEESAKDRKTGIWAR